MKEFTLAPRKIIETDKISDRDKIIYLKLLDFAFNNVYCFPKIETVAERLNVSVDTVKRATRTLREVGLIKIYREHSRAVNTYVLIPTDWIDFEPVSEEEQYIENKVDFELLVDRIRVYYEELGRKIAKPKRRRSTKRTTLQDLINNLTEKLASGDLNLNAKELCIYFAKVMQEEKGMTVSIDWGRDGAIMKDLFISNPNLDIETSLKLIETYVKSYDRHFKKPNYPYPRISYLKMEFIFNKVVRLCLYEMENAHQEQEGEIATF